jgi:hypothetical protein
VGQYRPSKVTGGVRYAVDVWEDSSRPSAPWRWRIGEVSLDKDGNPNGPWKEVTSDSEQTEAKAQESAIKALDTRTRKRSTG